MNPEQLIEFIGNHPLLMAGTLVVIALLIGNEVVMKRRGFNTLSTVQLIKAVNQDDAMLIDLRDRGAFKKGHVVGAVNLPIDKLSADPAKVNAGKDKMIVVYCDNGANSSRAAGLLKGAGFSDISILKGGIASWQQENLPVESV